MKLDKPAAEHAWMLSQSNGLEYLGPQRNSTFIQVRWILGLKSINYSACPQLWGESRLAKDGIGKGDRIP